MPIMALNQLDYEFHTYINLAHPFFIRLQLFPRFPYACQKMTHSEKRSEDSSPEQHALCVR